MTRTVVIRIPREKRLRVAAAPVAAPAVDDTPLTQLEAAAVLGISRQHLSRLTASGDVPAHYLGTRPRYFRDEILGWLRSRGNEAAA